MTNRTYKSGTDRAQLCFLPLCPEDYVTADNPVRAIDAYVGSLDLRALGFRHAEARRGAGQPAYDPADLLKLYLYGYLNQVRSSRRLAREAERNLELIWLLKGLAPGYRCIADFRKDSAGALRAANRDFVLVMRELDLLGGEVVAIDGSFFHGDASKASITTRKTLEKQIAAIEADIAAYEQALAGNDAAEAGRPERGDKGKDGASKDGASPADRLKALLAKRQKRQADLDALERSGETQVSRTDPDARLLAKSGQSVAGYNVQSAVDARHKLILASEVVNDGNDIGQLHAMAEAAKAALGADKLNVVADAGYYDGEEIRACEAAWITPYVPEPDRAGRAVAAGRFGVKDFLYEPEADAYRCPGDQLLRPMGKLIKIGSGKRCRRYVSRQAACTGGLYGLPLARAMPERQSEAARGFALGA